MAVQARAGGKTLIKASIRSWSLPALFVALSFLCSCAFKQVDSRVSSVSEQRPLYRGRVRVKATSVPPGARQLAVVQAWGDVSLVEAIQELTMKTRSVGANFVKVDAVYTRYLTETHSSNASGVYTTHEEEVPRLVVVGRAFWVETDP